ncbi:hypothetical protein BB559_003768 [Furculomyces boomerangus]|uniref:Ubiquitin-like protease family profile domain-containing protein n=2 Tax=Harpellales TaxID=61421 RepID=A0A2T9YIX7_9FUNG|nr:hypothetical protein BB559_003768 [Furculomyces boomerangus]PWA00645.1 hypothetical protein BB558_003301 [Smittium angustum]
MANNENDIDMIIRNIKTKTDTKSKTSGKGTVIEIPKNPAQGTPISIYNLLTPPDTRNQKTYDKRKIESFENGFRNNNKRDSKYSDDGTEIRKFKLKNSFSFDVTGRKLGVDNFYKNQDSFSTKIFKPSGKVKAIEKDIRKTNLSITHQHNENKINGNHIHISEEEDPVNNDRFKSKNSKNNIDEDMHRKHIESVRLETSKLKNTNLDNQKSDRENIFNNSDKDIAEEMDIVHSEENVENITQKSNKKFTENVDDIVEENNSNHKKAGDGGIRISKKGIYLYGQSPRRSGRKRIDPSVANLVIGKMKPKGETVGFSRKIESSSPRKSLDTVTNYKSENFQKFYEKSRNTFTGTSRITQPGSLNSIVNNPQNPLSRSQNLIQPSLTLSVYCLNLDLQTHKASKKNKITISVIIRFVQKTMSFAITNRPDLIIPVKFIKKLLYSNKDGDFLICLMVNKACFNPKKISINLDEDSDQEYKEKNNNYSYKNLYFRLDMSDSLTLGWVRSGTIETKLKKFMGNGDLALELAPENHSALLDKLGGKLSNSVSLLTDSESELEPSSENPNNKVEREPSITDDEKKSKYFGNPYQLRNNNWNEPRGMATRRLTGSLPGMQHKVERLLSHRTLFQYPFTSTHSIAVTAPDVLRLRSEEFLNDTIIDFYLRYLMENLKVTNNELFKQVFVYSSFFYEQYCKNPKIDTQKRFDSVRKWTSKVDLLSKKYLFVPINKHQHWFLALIINPQKLVPENVDANSSPEKFEDEKYPKRNSSQTEAIDNNDDKANVNFSMDNEIDVNNHKDSPCSDKNSRSSPCSQQQQDDSEDVLSEETSSLKRDLSVESCDDEKYEGHYKIEEITENTENTQSSTENSGNKSFKYANSIGTSSGAEEEKNEVISIDKLTALSEIRGKRNHTENNSDGATGAIDLEEITYENTVDNIMNQFLHQANKDLAQNRVSSEPIPDGDYQKELSDGNNNLDPRSLSLNQEMEDIDTHNDISDFGIIGDNSIFNGRDIISNEKSNRFNNDNQKDKTPTPSQDKKEAHDLMKEVEDIVDELITSSANNISDKTSPIIMKSQMRLPDNIKEIINPNDYCDPDSRTWIVVFDSLRGRHTSVIENLSNYIKCVVNDISGGVNDSKIQGRYAKVPKQPNFCDCGLYLLQYVEEFFLDHDRIAELVVNKVNAENWFSSEIVSNKRVDMERLCVDLMRSYQKHLEDQRKLKKESETKNEENNK